MTIGTKRQVYEGMAEKTVGGLRKNQLMKNKSGKVVSKKKHALGLKAINILKSRGFVKSKSRGVRRSGRSHKAPKRYQ